MGGGESLFALDSLSPAKNAVVLHGVHACVCCL